MTIQYIHFTDQQKTQARLTDIADLLFRQGETLKRSGSEYEWRDGSAKVTIRGHLWYHQYEQTGGDAIDFVRRYFNKSYPEAVIYLLEDCDGWMEISSPVGKKDSKPFELPRKNKNMRRVYDYLMNRRNINREVVSAFVRKGMIYESAEYHNAVFVGFDSDGNPRHAHKRGTGSQSSYKGNVVGSLPEYSFHWNGISSRLYLFEAPIDMLSFITMNKENWWQHSYAASCGVSDQVLWQMIKDNPQIKSISLCRDNDEAGQVANKRTSDALFVKGFQHEILIPIRKDWNEDLLYPEETEEEICTQQQL